MTPGAAADALILIADLIREGVEPSDQLMDAEAAAEFLNNTTIERVRRLAREKQIPAKKIGNEWVFSRRALFEFVRSGQ